MSIVEVEPLSRPFDVEVAPPGSKSLTIRALVAASLALGTSILRGGLESEDTRAARRAVSQLGAEITEVGDAWQVRGGDLAPGPHRLDTGESGLTTRIMIAVAALVDGPTRIQGHGRLNERPMAGLLQALEQLGVETHSREGRLPVVIRGQGRLSGGPVEVDISRSTQFATALALVSPRADSPLDLRIVGRAGSLGYLDLTVDVLNGFGVAVERTTTGIIVSNTGLGPTEYVIEPDASAAVYPLVGAALTGSRVTISGLGSASHQPDIAVVRHLEEMGCHVRLGEAQTILEGPGGKLQPLDADLSGCPDGALALAVACLRASGPSRLRGLHTLVDKESNRLTALATEITRAGGEAVATEDELTIDPGVLRPARIETYSDHRIAMSLALLGLIQPGIEIVDAEVVAKTWPGYWEMLGQLESS